MRSGSWRKEAMQKQQGREERNPTMLDQCQRKCKERDLRIITGKCSDEPLLVSRKILEEDSRIEHKVTTSAKCCHRNEETEDDPVG